MRDIVLGQVTWVKSQVTLILTAGDEPALAALEAYFEGVRAADELRNDGCYMHKSAYANYTLVWE